VEPGRGENHAIGLREARVAAKTCGGHGESSVEIDHCAVLHDGHGAQCGPLVALLEHPHEHLESARVFCRLVVLTSPC
jgi:hypothetical protein